MAWYPLVRTGIPDANLLQIHISTMQQSSYVNFLDFEKKYSNIYFPVIDAVV